MGRETSKLELRTDLVPTRVATPVEVAQGLAVLGGEHEIVKRAAFDARCQQACHGAWDRDLACLLRFRPRRLRHCLARPRRTSQIANSEKITAHTETLSTDTQSASWVEVPSEVLTR